MTTPKKMAALSVRKTSFTFPKGGIDTSIDYLVKYLSTYKGQAYYEDYDPEIFIDDIVYGLGVALGSEFRNADGYRKFKGELVKYFQKTTPEHVPEVND